MPPLSGSALSFIRERSPPREARVVKKKKRKKEENSQRREIILPFPLGGTINEAGAESFRRTFAVLNNAEGGEFVPGYRGGNFQFR